MPKLLRRVVKIIFVSLTALSVCISAAAYLVLPLPGLRSYSGPPPILAFDANWGSGFFIDGAGHVITNRHVVTDCRRITVAGWNFRAAPARVVSLPNDPLTDLALLRVDVEPPAALAFSEDPWPAAAAEGQVVSSDQVGGAMRAAAPLSEGRAAMIGYPGDDLGPAPESTSVKVLDTASTTDMRHWLRRFEARVTQGNSGSPIVNDRGEVLGVAVALTYDLDAKDHAPLPGSITHTEHGLAGRTGLMIPAATASALAGQAGRPVARAGDQTVDPSRAVVRIFCFRSLPHGW